MFLLHQDPAAARIYLTLQQAMKQKKVVVYETEQVNELAIENISSQPMFCNAATCCREANRIAC